jgi:hypothetical protein
VVVEGVVVVQGCSCVKTNLNFGRERHHVNDVAIRTAYKPLPECVEVRVPF